MSTHQFSTISNTRTIELINHEGIKVEERVFVNTPFQELFPDEPLVIVDWLAVDARRPDEALLQKGIDYGGKTYYGAYAWGSAVKQGQTYGLTRDLPVETGVVKNAEDGQRFGRWLMAQGIFGGVRGKLRVKVAKAGTLINGNPVEDGFGYVSRAVAEAGWNGHEKIVLDESRESYTFWQRIPWEAVREEFEPRIRDHMVDMSEPQNMAMARSSYLEEKKRWMQVDPDMVLHPYVANALSRAAAELYFRAATSAPKKAHMRVAVPTLAKKVAVPFKAVIDRQPIDSNGNIQAVGPDETGDYKRIEGLEVIQYTLGDTELFAKGCLGVLNSLPDDYDVVICDEDIKMALVGVNEVRKCSSFEADDVCLVFTQWFSQGCALGVNANWAKKPMGLDHDGDLVSLTDCTDLPLLWKAVSNLPKQETAKLEKTHRPIAKGDKRAEMISKSMSNLVGYATVIMAATYMTTDREEVARGLGFKSEAEMDYILNRYIKAGTDGFKTDVDLEKIERHLGVLQSALIQLFGVLAPWTKWLKDPWAFKRGIPTADAIEDLPTELKKLAVKRWMNGTIANICRLTLPNLEVAMKAPIEANLLSYYRNWAPGVDEDHLMSAYELQLRFNAMVRRVNFASVEDIASFKVRYQQEIAKWIEAMGYSRQEAAAALWRVAHSSRSDNASGASVFIGMPLEAEWIVREKPGLKEKAVKTVVTGLNRQLPGVDRLTATVDVVECKTLVSNKLIVRMALVGHVSPEQQQPADPYPADMLCLVAKNAEQPEKGHYLANIWKLSEAAWGCELIPA